ncbi:MAG: ATP-binding protein [Steroidobacteraceae bacterium]
MNAASEDRGVEYRRALTDFLSGAGEDALLRAYEIGRQAMAGGVGLLEMVTLHHDALRQAMARLPPDQRARAIRSAEAFLVETLSPYEMSQQAVGEANSILRRLNQLLEEEARRIAHALHDEAGGILASARIALDLALRGQPAGIAERLTHVRQLLDDTGERLRHLSHELRPTILDDLGLRAALVFLAQGVSQRSGVRTTVVGEMRGRPPPNVELAVYRVAQEALNNAIRHAQGVAAMTIHLRHQRGELRCAIQNDGAGFHVDAVMSDRHRSGLGLLGMRERIQSIGGTLTISSTPGNGTTVEIRIPW